MKRPALIHTSTCFVAGNRSGEVWEDEELVGYFPRRKELPGTHFSVEQEIADSDRMAAEVRAQADDAQVVAHAARAGARPPARAGPRPRRRGGAEAGAWPASARTGSARS